MNDARRRFADCLQIEVSGIGMSSDLARRLKALLEPHRHDGWSTAVDPRESVPAALGILYLADGDPAETILGCANFGRDADTIATIGGAVAGALRGGARIPTAWIESVTAACPVDQAALATDLLAVLLRRAERAASWGAMVLGWSEQ